jgi:hypothetical protein
MKHLPIAALIALSTSAAFAAPFSYQQQVGSSELDPSIWDAPALTAQPFTVSNLIPSVFTSYWGVDIDGSPEFAYVGEIVPSVFAGNDNYKQVMTEVGIN